MAPTRWWRELFYDHPLRHVNPSVSKLAGDRQKVYCKACYDLHFTEEQAKDQQEITNGTRSAARLTESITTELWSTSYQSNKVRGYLNSRVRTLLVHLEHCTNQPKDVREHAYAEKTKKPGQSGGNEAGGGGNMFVVTPNIEHPVPSYYPSLGQAGPSNYHCMPLSTLSRSASLSALPYYPQTPGISAPASPSDWSAPPSHSSTPAPSSINFPYATSPSPSPSISGSANDYRPAKRTRHTSRSSGLRVVHQPNYSGYAVVGWNESRQSRFDSLLARLTASANFPLTWVENPIWLIFCDEFLPPAVVPSRWVLTTKLLPSEVEYFRAQAIAITDGHDATVQGDGWTGINNHHLVAFMLTANRQAHTVRVVDVSNERHTGENFLKLIDDTFNHIKKDWRVTVIAFVSDASGEARKARKLLYDQNPNLIVLDCYAHQINLIVGDYFKSHSAILVYAEKADGLITWLRKRTYVLAIIRDTQVSLGKTALTVIRAVLTRWTAHYLAYRRLLQLQPTLRWIIHDDEVRARESRFLVGAKTAQAKRIARQMVELMSDGLFWHSLARMKLHLEPLAVSANVAQAAHCRLDQVLLIFGFLYLRYSKLDDPMELDIKAAILSSIERRWAKADQEVFIAAVVFNPLYKTKPFADIPEFTKIALYGLVERLWKRLFLEDTAPKDLRAELAKYLDGEERYGSLEIYVAAARAEALEKHKPFDPIDIWHDLCNPGKPQPSLVKLACRILSVCANSASCERLFSIFGQLLTKLRNRLRTETLTCLAELKLHLRDECARNGVAKDRLRRHFGQQHQPSAAHTTAPMTEADPTLTAAPLSTPEQSSQPTVPDSIHDTCSNDDTGEITAAELEAAHMPAESLRNIADGLIQFTEQDKDEADFDGFETIFSRPISELFDFENSHWADTVAEVANIALDDELDLYELLDLDAEGEEAVDDTFELDDSAHDILTM